MLMGIVGAIVLMLGSPIVLLIDLIQGKKSK